MSGKSSGKQFSELMSPILITTKAMEMPKCGERKGLLIIQSIQAHLRTMVEAVYWLGLAWPAYRTGSFMFIDDGRIRMNSEYYRNILSDSLQRNASKQIGRKFII